MGDLIEGDQTHAVAVMTMLRNYRGRQREYHVFDSYDEAMSTMRERVDTQLQSVGEPLRTDSGKTIFCWRPDVLSPECLRTETGLGRRGAYVGVGSRSLGLLNPELLIGREISATAQHQIAAGGHLCCRRLSSSPAKRWPNHPAANTCDEEGFYRARWGSTGSQRASTVGHGIRIADGVKQIRGRSCTSRVARSLRHSGD
jgi:hypothetical protein